MLTKNGTREIPGYRIKPMPVFSFPIHVGLFGSRCDEAEFGAWDGKPCLTAKVCLKRARSSYILHLTIEQALAAGLIERTE